MSLDNEYTEKGNLEQKSETKKKSTAQKKSGKKGKKKSKSPFTKLFGKIDKKKLKSTIGVISILLAFYILLACFSYLLTLKDDQDRVI